MVPGLDRQDLARRRDREARPPCASSRTGSRAAGFAGCNRFAGHYTLSGQDLKFGPMAATKMSCDQMKTEDRYLAALAVVVGWSLADGRAHVVAGDNGPALLFRELTPTRRVK